MAASGLGLYSPSDKWSAGKRVAFRFGLLYFALYCLTNQIFGGVLPVPKIEIPDLGSLPPVRPVVLWTASHLFHAPPPVLFAETGSGDRTFDWVLVFCALMAAAIGTAVWSALDRRRESYTRAYRWFHLGIRFAVASEMVTYGMIKAVPMQMPFPFLTRLVEPFGNFSPMGILWNSVGASPAYEMCTGSAELLAGVLLFFPRTTLLGALVALGDSIFIFTLNMTYDVPVKVFSFHLIVMSLVLLGPDLGRLRRFFLSSGTVEGPRLPVWGRRAVVAQAIYGALVLAGYGQAAWERWHSFGPGAPKSELYGIWNVAEPKDGWRRVIFERPGNLTLQRMDDSFARFEAKIDGGQIALTKAADKTWTAEWRFQRAGADGLRIEGEMDGKALRWELKLVDRAKLMLISRGFHWIQEYPFNR
jgi:hypothetical protein